MRPANPSEAAVLGGPELVVGERNGDRSSRARVTVVSVADAGEQFSAMRRCAIDREKLLALFTALSTCLAGFWDKASQIPIRVSKFLSCFLRCQAEYE